MSEVRVIATDLDGTLVHRGRVSERTRKALVAARERGIAVVAATARTPRNTDSVPGLADLLDGALCNNGALRWHPATGAVEVRGAIDKAAVTDLHERLKAALPDSTFAIESGSAVYAQRLPSKPHQDDPWHRVETLDQALDAVEHVVEYRIVDLDAGPAGMLAAAGHLTVPGATQWTWRDFPVIQYNAAGVDKGRALAEWCAERGIAPESAVAFGDERNDMPMLTWAGRSYAIEGCPPEVAAAADALAPPTVDDGVAQVIEGLLEPFEARP